MIQNRTQDKTHGGRRIGSGRKKRRIGELNHIKRPVVTERTPLYITIKLRTGLPSLRTMKHRAALLRGVQKAAATMGFAVRHFAVISNHIHLIVEAVDNVALARGMKCVCATLARTINRIREAKGAIFLGRFHLHVLRTRREVRNAMTYVLFNLSKHMRCQKLVDELFSTIGAFRELEELVGPLTFARLAKLKDALARGPEWPAPIGRAQSWLLRMGWR